MVVRDRGIAAVGLLLVLGLAGCGTAGDSRGSTPGPDDELVIVSPTPGLPLAASMIAGKRELYVVQAGDSLSALAERFGVSEEALRSVNHLTDPNHLVAGQELIIPEPGS
jgi:nucleoid-associated protein YgaU